MLNMPNPQRNNNLWQIEKKSYDQPRQHIKKQRHYFASKGPSCQSYGFSNSHEWTCELDYKESWALKNWCFWTAVLERTLESPLDCKEIKPVHPKENQSWVWIFIGRTDVEAETSVLWLPDEKNWLLGKYPDEAWHAAVPGFTKSWTRLSDWTELTNTTMAIIFQ